MSDYKVSNSLYRFYYNNTNEINKIYKVIYRTNDGDHVLWTLGNDVTYVIDTGQEEEKFVEIDAAYAEKDNEFFIPSHKPSNNWEFLGWTTSKTDISGDVLLKGEATINDNNVEQDIVVYAVYKDPINLTYKRNYNSADNVSDKDTKNAYYNNGNSSLPSFKMKSPYTFLPENDDKVFTDWEIETLDENGLPKTIYIDPYSNVNNPFQVPNNQDREAKAYWIDKVKEYPYRSPSSYVLDPHVEFTVPANGKYLLEVWGAQGGSRTNDYFEGKGEGGKGGYTYLLTELNKGDILYVYLGGKGQSVPKYLEKTDTEIAALYEKDNPGSTYPTDNSEASTQKRYLILEAYRNLIFGGYNGGGAGSGVDRATSGGGCSHIIKDTPLLLEKAKDNINNILIIAGGGGGCVWANINHPKTNVPVNGGDGGGPTGKNGGNYINAPNATGGTSVKGGDSQRNKMDSYSHMSLIENATFGKGAGRLSSGPSIVNEYIKENWATCCGGGAGKYGGGCFYSLGNPMNSDVAPYWGSGAGGSGYVSDPTKGATLSAGEQYIDSQTGETKTYQGNEGNGFARITYIGRNHVEVFTKPNVIINESFNEFNVGAQASTLSGENWKASWALSYHHDRGKIIKKSTIFNNVSEDDSCIEMGVSTNLDEKFYDLPLHITLNEDKQLSMGSAVDKERYAIVELDVAINGEDTKTTGYQIRMTGNGNYAITNFLLNDDSLERYIDSTYKYKKADYTKGNFAHLKWILDRETKKYSYYWNDELIEKDIMSQFTGDDQTPAFKYIRIASIKETLEEGVTGIDTHLYVDNLKVYTMDVNPLI